MVKIFSHWIKKCVLDTQRHLRAFIINQGLPVTKVVRLSWWQVLIVMVAKAAITVVDSEWPSQQMRTRKISFQEPVCAMYSIISVNNRRSYEPRVGPPHKTSKMRTRRIFWSLKLHLCYNILDWRFTISNLGRGNLRLTFDQFHHFPYFWKYSLTWCRPVLMCSSHFGKEYSCVGRSEAWTLNHWISCCFVNFWNRNIPYYIRLPVGFHWWSNIIHSLLSNYFQICRLYWTRVGTRIC